ncbi:MAG: chemotaxis protein CheR [Desulfuromonas sp.]|nr:MAG: chemotaxis protein CheR [Desulfuromonas sp.]
MNDEEFRLLRDFVYQYCGMFFKDESKYLLQKRLGRRLQHHRLRTFREYYYLLRYSPNKDQELTELINLVTTNETYFFREEFQLKTFVADVLPEVRERKQAQGQKRLRIWSAGCSTGEEPYTLAMLMMEDGKWDDWQVDIIGTDICQRVLQSARQGVYSESAFRSTERYFRDRYFQKEGARYRIEDRVKKWVTISHLNLLDAPRVSLLGYLDVVFCRNVIIYFDAAAKRKVIDAFYQRLHPEGFLLLGHSESLMNLSNAFQLRHLTHDMVYQKPARQG